MCADSDADTTEPLARVYYVAQKVADIAVAIA